MFKILLVSFGILVTPVCVEAQTYIVRVKLPEQLGMKEAPGLKAFYKGCPIDLDKCCAILPENENILTISVLIIQDDIDFHGSNNSIRYLKRPQDKQCKWYDLTISYERLADCEEDIYRWYVKERTSEEVPTRIPDNTIIMFFDPELVEVLTPEPELLKHGVISMPLITFKRDIKPEVFEDALLYSTLASLDLSAIHCKTQECTHYCKTAVISLAL